MFKRFNLLQNLNLDATNPPFRLKYRLYPMARRPGSVYTSNAGGVRNWAESALTYRTESLSAKILLVDDHEIVRHGIRSLLERMRPDWQVCGEAANGQEAIAAVRTLAPDVVILDVTMPVMNGLQAAVEINKLKTLAVFWSSPCTRRIG